GTQRQSEIRWLFPVEQLAKDRRADVHAARAELRRVLYCTLGQHVLRLRRRRRRSSLGARGDVLPDARVWWSKRCRSLFHEEVAARQLRRAGDGGTGRKAWNFRSSSGRFARRSWRV